MALSCWADGARAGRFAAAELKVDVVAKELQGMEMVVPRDAASFPSAPSMRRTSTQVLQGGSLDARLGRPREGRALRRGGHRVREEGGSLYEGLPCSRQARVGPPWFLGSRTQ